MLDDLTASDEELIASIAGLRKDTDQLLIDVNQGMADYKELSDERAADLKESFESGIAAIKNTHEGGIAQMMVEYTNQMVQAEKDMDRVTDTWDQRCVNCQLKVSYNDDALIDGYVFSDSGKYYCPPHSKA